MFHDSPLVIVEDERAVRDLARRLSSASVIGVDTEADSMYHYQEKVCLIQFTDADGDIIVDPIRARDLSPLADIFSNPAIVKIFHGADYDIVSMRRDFGFRARNIFDTLSAGQFTGVERLGYADLVDRYFGIHLDKRYQKHDWSLRPLEPEHLDYARGDTHWLPALREILLRRLQQIGKVEHHREECELLEEREWQRKVFDPDGWARVKGASVLDDDGRKVLKRLHAYRDQQARDMDRPTYRVISDLVLVDIALRRPRNARMLADLIPSMRGLRRRHEDALVDCVLDALHDPVPEVAVHEAEQEPDDGPPARVTGRAAERVFEALKEWRNSVAHRNPQHGAAIVASNSTLKRVARARPYTLEELSAVPEVRRWQVREHGAAMLEVLDRVAPRAGGRTATSSGGRSRSR